MNSRRHALTLAAALAAATLTGGAAVLGVVHKPPAPVAQSVVAQQAAPASQPQQRWEDGD